MHFDCLNNHPVEQRRELVLGHNFLIPFLGGFFLEDLNVIVGSKEIE